jgi:hypothetical protein
MLSQTASVWGQVDTQGAHLDYSKGGMPMRKFQRFILTMLLWGVPMGPALAQTPAPAFESSTARIAA